MRSPEEADTQMPQRFTSLPLSFAAVIAMVLSLSVGFALPMAATPTWAQTSSGAPFNDVEAQLRVKQAATAAAAAAGEADQWRKALEAERRKTVASTEERATSIAR